MGFGTVFLLTGVIILPTQTMHLYKGNSLKFTIKFAAGLIPPKIGNLMTP